MMMMMMMVNDKWNDVCRHRRKGLDIYRWMDGRLGYRWRCTYVALNTTGIKTPKTLVDR